MLQLWVELLHCNRSRALKQFVGVAPRAEEIEGGKKSCLVLLRANEQ